MHFSWNGIINLPKCICLWSLAWTCTVCFIDLLKMVGASGIHLLAKKNITSFAESYRGWVCAKSGTFHNGYYHLIKLWDVSIVLFFTNWKKTKWRKYSKFFLCHQWRKTCVCALFKFVYLTNDHSLTFCRLDPNVCTVHQNRILSWEISGISNYI